MKNILSFALVLMLVFTVASVAGEKKVEIKVDGMTCNGCVDKVKTTLEKAEGVKTAEVSLKENSAVILYDDSKTDEASLKKAINSTGFKAVDGEEAKAQKSGCGDAAPAASSCGDK